MAVGVEVVAMTTVEMLNLLENIIYMHVIMYLNVSKYQNYQGSHSFYGQKDTQRYSDHRPWKSATSSTITSKVA